MCFTLPELILAKVLTTPLLSKYAIFWLGTSTIELGEGGREGRFFLSFLFFFFFPFIFLRFVTVVGALILVCDMYTCQHGEAEEGGLSPGTQTGRVAHRQIDKSHSGPAVPGAAKLLFIEI